jgi:hypothetical protein
VVSTVRRILVDILLKQQNCLLNVTDALCHEFQSRGRYIISKIVWNIRRLHPVGSQWCQERSVLSVEFAMHVANLILLQIKIKSWYRIFSRVRPFYE